jgi:hypothetical protein
LDYTALQQEPLHLDWSRPELCKAKLKSHNASQYPSSIVVSMCHGAIPVGWHTNGIGKNYDQTGSGAPEAKKSQLAMNYFGSMVTTKMAKHFINFFRCNTTWKINFPQFFWRTHHLP